ncbi:MAG: hypothetical protein AAF411_23390 [Myxococcota bacterium]
MAGKRLEMSQVKEILRRVLGEGQSLRAAARSLGIGHSVVGRLRQRAKLAGVDWAEASQLSEEALKERLYAGE